MIGRPFKGLLALCMLGIALFAVFTDRARADAREIALLAGISNPEVCTPIDLRDGPKGEIFRKPIDQGDVGWCYAYASAALLSYKLGIEVSAVDLSYTYNREVSRSFFERLQSSFDRGGSVYDGGGISDAVKRFSERGGCSERGMPSNQTFLDPSAFYSELKKWRIEERKQNLDLSFQDRCNKVEKFLKENINDMILYLRTLFPAASMDVVAAAVIRGDQQEFNEFLSSLSKVACAPSDRIPPQPNLTTQGRGHYSNIGQINLQLDRRNPVGIEYRVNRFLRKGFNGGGHSSVVIGRQWINGKCNYLIRNSWGESCSMYGPRVTACDPDSSSFWVKEDDLSLALDNIEYIP